MKLKTRATRPNELFGQPNITILVGKKKEHNTPHGIIQKK